MFPAGTPELTVVEARWEEIITSGLVLRLRQRRAPNPGQPEKLPLVIPMKFGLIGKHSKKDLLHPPMQVGVSLAVLQGGWLPGWLAGCTFECYGWEDTVSHGQRKSHVLRFPWLPLLVVRDTMPMRWPHSTRATTRLLYTSACLSCRSVYKRANTSPSLCTYRPSPYTL